MSQQTSSSPFESTKNELEVRNGVSPQMRGEEYSERYDRNDTIHEPPQKEFRVGGPDPTQSETTLDANMITWDGPNDPSNPQNWSIKYKYFVTAVSVVMTINVYVYLLISLF
jgi:hypothetical protein